MSSKTRIVYHQMLFFQGRSATAFQNPESLLRQSHSFATQVRSYQFGLRQEHTASPYLGLISNLWKKSWETNFYSTAVKRKQINIFFHQTGQKIHYKNIYFFLKSFRMTLNQLLIYIVGYRGALHSIKSLYGLLEEVDHIFMCFIQR